MAVTDAEVEAALDALPHIDIRKADMLDALEAAEKVRTEETTPKPWMELTVGEQDRFARLVGAPMEECAPHYAAYLRGWEAQRAQVAQVALQQQAREERPQTPRDRHRTQGYSTKGREIPTSENAYTGIPDSDLGGQS